MQTNEIVKKESPIDQTFGRLDDAIRKLDKLVESFINKTDKVLYPESQIPSDDKNVEPFVQKPVMSSMNVRLNTIVQRIDYITQTLDNAYRRNEL